MSALDPIAACAGRWQGTNTLHDPNTGGPEESPSTLTVTPVLGGRFVRIDYDWGYQGKPQEGSLLLGFEPKAGEVSGHWIDTWHMGRKGLACLGASPTGRTLSVHGTWPAPPDPDWGWRIEITPEEDGTLRVAHVCIDSKGEESPAVDAVYSRA